MPKSARQKPVIEEIDSPPDPFVKFKSMRHRPYSFFLDSACGAEKLGRFSFMGCDPFLVFRSKGDSVKLEWESGLKKELIANPFLELRKLLRKYRVVNSRKEIPFTCGAVGYFSYDLKDFIEVLPNTAKDDLDLPDCLVGFYDSVVIYDNLKKRSYISKLGISKKPFAPHDAVYRDSTSRRISCKGLKSNFSKRSYVDAVKMAKRYIEKGDIYQVNISQRFKAKLSGDPFDLYARLRRCSPAPFASYLNFNDVAILSSSPERFLLKRGDYIETRPIKGTRPRGASPSLDAALETELKHSAKDMAEHIMIVDLERNDLGRICKYGSIRPTESVVIEKYANVSHLVSTVAGTLKKGKDPVDCLIAAFPGGSITGAPKIRSMEIIDELESVKRSVYTGAIGYIGFDGNMDTSIVIRAFIAKGNDIYFQVGGGIVADSDPEKEYEETIHKAAGAMQALGIGKAKRERVLA
ncbi:MAG: aminodeoxychorismate synthase component I [Candidatus Omnitrophica bacterium]|nr:aminodeoxychorismate synthase component I [Candidatus Omnitrophota bacterium]